MSSNERCSVGDWAEVECVLLEPADRAANLPADTAALPLLQWVKGFAQADASLGADLTVKTMTGRLVTGKLSAVNPGYFHTFGRPIPALWHVGADLRDRLAEYRATEGGDPR